MTAEQAPRVNELVVVVADPGAAERELGWGAALAGALRVPVHLVHVMDPAQARDPLDYGLAVAHDLLAIAATDRRWAGRVVTFEAIPGLLDEELPRVASSRPGAILLLATEESSQLGWLRVGDWGALLRRLTTPFVLLPPGVIPPRTISTAVVGLDGSDHAQRVSAMAAEFATRLELAAVVVEAIEPGTTHGPEFLATVAEISETHVRARGRAGQTIAAVARARDAGLIVVGSHGYGQMTRLLLGSTSEWLARNSDRPVLIVPAPRS